MLMHPLTSSDCAGSALMTVSSQFQSVSGHPSLWNGLWLSLELQWWALLRRPVFARHAEINERATRGGSRIFRFEFVKLFLPGVAHIKPPQSVTDWGGFVVAGWATMRLTRQP
jgi:hypothetical protein